MNLELKNLKTLASLSEETHCFTATLYVDGSKSAEISNHGHGGSDDVHWFNRETEAKVKSYFEAQPETEIWGVKMRPSLEIWCGEEINAHLLRKQAKKLVKQCETRCIAKRGDDILVYKLPPRALAMIAPKDGVTYRALIEKRDNVVFLNGMVEAHVYHLIAGDKS